MKTTEELLMMAVNKELNRTKVMSVKSHGAYDLYDFELDNNNILMWELMAISEVTGDDDLQVESMGHFLKVIATIDDEQIEEIIREYEEVEE